MTKTFAITSAIALGVVLVGTGVYAFWPREVDCGGGAVAGGFDAMGGAFSLTDAQGNTVTEADLLDGPALLYFGYTFCPDVCPVDTVRNATAAEMLADDGVEVTPIFVSVDPARDTPEVVGEFAANVSENMIGLTGTPEQIRDTVQAFRAYASVPAEPEDEYYLVGHSTFTYLVTEGGKVLDYFRREEPAEAVASRAACRLGA